MLHWGATIASLTLILWYFLDQLGMQVISSEFCSPTKWVHILGRVIDNYCCHWCDDEGRLKPILWYLGINCGSGSYFSVGIRGKSWNDGLSNNSWNWNRDICNGHSRRGRGSRNCCSDRIKIGCDTGTADTRTSATKVIKVTSKCDDMMWCSWAKKLNASAWRLIRHCEDEAKNSRANRLGTIFQQ